MNITILYAAVLAVFFIFLSVRTIRMRRTLRIGVGDAGNSKMLRAMRVHSNFAEYVPFSVFLIFLVEARLGYHMFVHALGLILLIGRLSHAYGVSQEKENFKFRITGMIMTFSVILSSSAYLLFSFIRG